MRHPPDNEGFVQLLPGTHESEKSIDNAGIDEVHLKCDSINSSILNDCREHILYSFALDKPPGHKKYKKP